MSSARDVERTFGHHLAGSGQVNDLERSVPEFETVQNRSRDVADSGTG